MDAPYSGSANASIRSILTPRAMTAASADIIPIMTGANRYSSVPVTAISPIPKATVSHPSLYVMSLRPAPTLCPTRVEAAACTP